ncbi:MAG TPA: class I SAM-dependent methyltransferase [Nocardioidaceae bacterium]|nr:class I SAM-dependent methyltransferase [Nocardioidaceae bacterium]
MGDLTITIAPSNLEQNRAWDGDEGTYWAAHARRFDEAVAGYHEPLMNASGIAPGSRVLDIGCGTGQTTRDAARRASSGSALGVDLSREMLDVARRLAEHEGVANATFLHADAQIHPFQAESFDVAISRTGSMFFGDPSAAFANIRRALRPGGRLAMVAWQPVSENEWFREITTAMAAGRDLPGPPPDAPNPYSLADPDRVRRLLSAAGFAEPAFEDLRSPMYFGPDAADAHRFIFDLTAWMLAGLDDAGRRRASEDLLASTTAHETEGGVVYGSAMWLTTTTAV